MKIAAETRSILLIDLNPVSGREQGGRRPVLVVSAPRYRVIPGLFLGVPLTSVNRDLPHHVRVDANADTGLDRLSFAMTEQPRALSLARVIRRLGQLDEQGFGLVSRYLHLFIV